MKEPLVDRWTTAREIARRVRSGEQSAEEVTDDALRRVETLGDAVNAVTFVDAPGSRIAAREIDRKVTSRSAGPLAGVPTLMKDLYGFHPGWPTTLGGIPKLADHRAPANAWSAYPRRTKDHGAVLLGQTNSSTFGFRGVTDNAHFGATRNPFDLTRNAGGSSGGSAAAVAAGMVPVAGASDAGGSIRIPAAWTHTFGFQPSAGAVPSTPRPAVYHLGPHLYEGVVSRTVEDAMLIMNVLNHYNPLDPYAVNTAPFVEGVLERGIKGKRVGLTVDFGGFPVDPRIRERILEAATVFEHLGASVEPVRLELSYAHEELTEMWLRSMGTLMLSDLDFYASIDIDLTDELPDSVQYWTEVAREMSLRDLIQDRVMRTAVVEGMLRLQYQYDFLIGPTVTGLPVLNSEKAGETMGPNRIDGHDVDPLIGWCPTYLTNFSGAPSATVPVGFADGLPVGLLIVGRKHEDDEVFAASAAFEQAKPWAAAYERVAV